MQIKLEDLPQTHKGTHICMTLQSCQMPAGQEEENVGPIVDSCCHGQLKIGKKIKCANYTTSNTATLMP